MFLTFSFFQAASLNTLVAFTGSLPLLLNGELGSFVRSLCTVYTIYILTVLSQIPTIPT